MAQFFSDVMPNWYVKFMLNGLGPANNGYGEPELIWRFIDDNDDPVTGSDGFFNLTGAVDSSKFQYAEKVGGWAPGTTDDYGTFTMPNASAFTLEAHGITLPITIKGVELVQEGTFERVWYQDLVSPVTLDSSNPSESNINNDVLYFRNQLNDGVIEFEIHLVVQDMEIPDEPTGLDPLLQLSTLWIMKNVYYPPQLTRVRYLELLDVSETEIADEPYERVSLINTSADNRVGNILPVEATGGEISNTEEIWMPLPACTVRYWRIMSSKTPVGPGNPPPVPYEIARGQLATDIVATEGQILKFPAGTFKFTCEPS